MKKYLLMLALMLFPLLAHAGPIWQPPRIDFTSPLAACFVDDFPIGGVNNASIGNLNWLFTTIGSAPLMARIASDANHPGVVAFSTAASPTANQGGTLSLGITSTGLVTGLGNTTNWFSYVVFRLRQTTEIRARAPFINDTGTGPPTTGIWIRYDTAAGFADTQFILECRNAGASTSVTTGVDADATTLHSFSLYPTASGTIAVSVDGAPPVSVASNCPTGQLSPAFQVLAEASTQKGLDIDYFLFCQTGLSR